MKFKTIDQAIVAIEALGGEFHSFNHELHHCTCEILFFGDTEPIKGIGKSALASVEDAYHRACSTLSRMREEIKPQPSGQARLGRAVTSGHDATLERGSR